MSTETADLEIESHDDMLFIIDIDYISNLSRIDRLLPDHRKWLEEHFDSGDFLMSGPKAPRSGGVVLARGQSREEVVSIAATDPFILARAALNRVTAFTATKTAEQLASVKPDAALALRGDQPQLFDINRNLLALSRWIDEDNTDRDPEAVTWGRIAKIVEEAGEAVAAYIGVTGQNPRKGLSHSAADVEHELLDVAIAALGAYEHVTDHAGTSMRALAAKLDTINARASLNRETQL